MKNENRQITCFEENHMSNLELDLPPCMADWRHNGANIEMKPNDVTGNFCAHADNVDSL